MDIKGKKKEKKTQNTGLAELINLLTSGATMMFSSKNNLEPPQYLALY